MIVKSSYGGVTGTIQPLVPYVTSLHSHELGSPCTKDRHCKVDNSYCSTGVCTCKHYHAQLGTKKCLESKLLGRECVVSEQCSLRVANSTCRDGHCHCSEGFVRFRKHTCLEPAKPGDVCYSDEHCRLGNRNTHCKFLIPKLFGKCIFENEGNNEANEGTKPPMTNQTVAETNQTTTNVDPTKVTSTEPSNEGEMSQQTNENTSEEMKNPSTEFVDPFLHQKEHLQGSTVQMVSTEKITGDVKTTTMSTANETGMEGEVTGDSESSTTEDVFSKTESTTVGENYGPSEVSTEGSKYRVEVESSESLRDVKAVSLGYSCRSDGECQKRDQNSRCQNGICDCVVKTNRTNSCNSKNTGCGPETFQCRESGMCISWFFVCDGRNDCSDKSDEECDGPKCPKSSFRCGPNGPCLSLAVICNGIKNCPNGEDEYFCSPNKRNSSQSCPENTLQCSNGQCLPKFEFCNAIPKCADGSDESPHLCSSQVLGKKTVPIKRKEICPFECGNGRCRSTAIVCSGRDGCGDNSDEAQCSICSCPDIPTSY